MEEHQVLIIEGETGSGKTTQIPQYLVQAVSIDIDRSGKIIQILQYFVMSSVIDREFEPRSCPTKDYEIGIYCLSAKHATLKR
jgi:hypothetical protein